jgi:uncharacterized repeat protein (TIGR03803 family)
MPSFLWSALTIGFLLPAPGKVHAQSFSTLHIFTGWDGAFPYGELLAVGDRLYGTASNGGGSCGPGSVFAVNTDGTGFSNLHALTEEEGGSPQGALLLADGVFYGTTSAVGNYGPNGYGTVFAINADGTGFRTVHRFAPTSVNLEINSGGARPFCSLILSGNTLFGTAERGGSLGKGTVFKVNTDGTGFTTLHNFTPLISGVDSGGHSPRDGLVLSGNTLYGTTRFGGGPDYGTIFAVSTSGTGFRKLHSFHGSDGATPNALVLSGNTLYGSTVYGGSANNGTIFAINTDGSGFRTLYSFTQVPGFPPYANADGGFPEGGLILRNGILYGTANAGGQFGTGAVFRLRTDGTDFGVIHSFSVGAFKEFGNYINSDGAFPSAGLILAGNALYGTTTKGGSSGLGTVFRLSLPPLSFADWATASGLTGPDAAADADPDGDGLPSAAEYILGGHPLAPDTSGRPAATASGDNLQFTFQRDDASETSDIILTVETGTDLITWPGVFTIGPDTAASSPGVNISENGTEPDTVTVTIPFGTAPHRFGRIKVTIIP